MLKVSPEFHAAAENEQREIKALLEVIFVDDPVLRGATASASSYIDETTHPRYACDGRIRPYSYQCGGDIPSEFTREAYGWQSEGKSDEEGNIEETLTINYPGEVGAKTIWFYSDEFNFPVDFTVEVFNGEWNTVAEVTNHSSAEWHIHLSNRQQIEAVRLNITRISQADSSAIIHEFGIPYRLNLDTEDIESLSILEEGSSDTDSPLGSVTSNEFSVGLRNDHRWLLPENTLSPFHHVLRPGAILKPYFGLKTGENFFECVPMGKFTTYDWAPSTEAWAAEVTGFDRLYVMAQDPPAKVPVIRNTTIAGLLRVIFQAYGLSPDEYVIDRNLVQPIEYAWLPHGDLFEALRTISAAGNCSITVDRLDRIVVRSNYVEPEPVATMTGQKHVFGFANPHSYRSMYSGTKVVYKIPSEGAVTQVLKLEGVTTPPGTMTLKDLGFSRGPVMRIHRYKVMQPSGVRVTSVVNGAWTCDIALYNGTQEDQTVDIEIYGTTIELVDAEFSLVNKQVEAMIGQRVLEVDNVLIQNLRVARMYGRSMLAYASDPGSTFKGEVRGNPALELFDIVEVSDPTTGMTEALVRPDKYSFNFDGGLRVVLEGRKPVEPKIPVFLSTGQIIQAPIRPDRLPF